MAKARLLCNDTKLTVNRNVSEDFENKTEYSNRYNPRYPNLTISLCGGESMMQ